MLQQLKFFRSAIAQKDPWGISSLDTHFSTQVSSIFNLYKCINNPGTFSDVTLQLALWVRPCYCVTTFVRSHPLPHQLPGVHPNVSAQAVKVVVTIALLIPD